MEEKKVNEELQVEEKIECADDNVDLDNLTKEKLDSLTKRLDHMVPDERY